MSTIPTICERSIDLLQWLRKSWSHTSPPSDRVFGITLGNPSDGKPMAATCIEIGSLEDIGAGSFEST